jgi:putative ABC transport system ATP-binding protein
MNKKGKTAQNILEVKNLKKSFYLKKREIAVLCGINLSVRRGEKVVISGKSGSGKSTLIHLLTGLERLDLGSGEIIFDGKFINKLSNEELVALRQKKIGIIFQNFNLLPSWSACENVEAALFFSGLGRDIRKEKATDLLTRLGLGDRFDNLPAELSIGEQQRVAFARALVNEPEIIFADEPTGDVDEETAEEIMKILFSWIAERNTTLLVVTHGEFPLDKGDRLLFLRDGVLFPTPK